MLKNFVLGLAVTLGSTSAFAETEACTVNAAQGIAERASRAVAVENNDVIQNWWIEIDPVDGNGSDSFHFVVRYDQKTTMANYYVTVDRELCTVTYIRYAIEEG